MQCRKACPPCRACAHRKNGAGNKPLSLIIILPKLMQRGGVLQTSGEGERVRPAHRTWLIMPFMHSERLADQQVKPIGVECLSSISVYS